MLNFKDMPGPLKFVILIIVVGVIGVTLAGVFS